VTQINASGRLAERCNKKRVIIGGQVTLGNPRKAGFKVLNRERKAFAMPCTLPNFEVNAPSHEVRIVLPLVRKSVGAGIDRWIANSWKKYDSA
jgi:hypothetical protein